ncbi:MAG: TIGR04283 family arsenosugar biosynthesis glycosyltransferase [bacterium]
MNGETVACIVPTLNEASGILEHLRYHHKHFNFTTILVVDGGSSDGTLEKVQSSELSIETTRISQGHRARQLKEGVRRTSASYLLFLHADSYLPRSFSVHDLFSISADWGWFDCTLDDDGMIYRAIGTMISLRSALFSSPTGDQAQWVKRTLLETIGGIPDQPLMEDVELSRRLRQIQRGHRIAKPVRTSARRWKQNGPYRTIITMWGLKVGYLLGLSPETLARYY